MNKLIIFDFNRTLYDPDTGQLIDGALRLVQYAAQSGYTLVLLAQATPSRANLIKELGLADFFAEIILTERKTLHHIHALEKKYQAKPKYSYLIGDRARGEIALGHAAGWQTIWLKQGRFATEIPEGFTPSNTVTDLTSVHMLI